jgi:hypothetical protein
VARLTET